MKRNDLSPLWCANDEPHEPHGESNEFGGWNHCSGRPDALKDISAPGERMVIYANSNVTRGKFAAAAVHAALTAIGAHHGGPVIVLGAKPSEIEKHATVIRDAGKTEVEPGTVTAGTDWRAIPAQGVRQE